jgi:hypothetical protein
LEPGLSVQSEEGGRESLVRGSDHVIGERNEAVDDVGIEKPEPLIVSLINAVRCGRNEQGTTP